METVVYLSKAAQRWLNFRILCPPVVFKTSYELSPVKLACFRGFVAIIAALMANSPSVLAIMRAQWRTLQDQIMVNFCFDMIPVVPPALKFID